MATIRDPGMVLQMLEGGAFINELRNEMTKAVKTLRDTAGEKGTAKGTLTLKLKFEVKGATCEITPEIAVKLPVAARMPETLFITAAGELSDEHPRQLSMFPRKAHDADAVHDTGTDD